MNPTSLYITTSRLVFQGDIVVELQDLNRLLPYLRKSLSCAVCCKLLVEPHSPSTGDCQHHICRVCVGKHKKLKPACRFCKGLLQYRENTQLRLLLQCYKSICTFIRSRPVYADICKCAPNQPGGGGTEGGGASTSGSSGTTPNSLMDLIEEGAAFVDDFKCNSGLSKSAYSILPCIFPPPVVTVQTPTEPKPTVVVPPPAPCCSKTTNKPKSVNKTTPVVVENGKMLQEKKKALRKVKASRQPKQSEREQQSAATQKRKNRSQTKQMPINSSLIRNVLPTRVGPTIIHAESLANRPTSGGTASKSALVPTANVPSTPLLTQPIIKNSCVPTTPRIVNITTPQEIKFEAAPIKTVSSGTTMYSVLYAESGNKFTIKRKPDPVSAAKPAQNGQQAKLATMVANSSRSIIPAKTAAGDVDQTKLTTIRRSLSELLQQYNAPATTTATTTASSDTLSAGSAGSSVSLGPTITAVTYSINALKPTNASTSVANGSTKVKVISAGQHQILHTTAKASPAAAVVKTGAGGGRTRTNGGGGVCLLPKAQNATVPTCGTITIRPFANSGFTGGTTTTISYLPSATQSSTATASVSGTMAAGTYASPLSRTMSQPSPASVRLSKPPARTSTVTSGSYATLSTGSTQSVDRDWTRLGGESVPGPSSVAKSFAKQSPAGVRTVPFPTLEIDRDHRIGGMSSRKPDALLSQSSVAMMPVTASPSSASFCSSPTVWSPSLPSNLFGSSVQSTGTGSPVGSGTNAPELSSLSGYDMNSFASISHMLDPDGVIDLCDDLELNTANLISLD
uniref:RING-type domain-containing protein n=1 Tax=Anopheles minimus TaxID=112268 RepID=A0A182W4L7_9DIPT